MSLTTDSQGKWLKFYNSSLGKKVITGVTGWGLVLFVLFHLVGNLLVLSDRNAYNQFANWLESLHFLLYGIELILLTSVVFHLVVGVSIRISAMQSRFVPYEKIVSAGKPSKQSLSSRSMAITGIVIFCFLIWHLSSFKFGTYYSTMVNGLEIRDLSRLVVEKFQSPTYAFGYTFAIACVGLHLRHGIWSAGQSLGILEGKNSSSFYKLSGIFAIAISLGFMAIPLTIYFGLVN